MKIQCVGVVGAGQMGLGIAQVAAEAGFDVIVSDVQLATAEKGLAQIRSQLEKLVSKGKITTERKLEVEKKLRAGDGLDSVKNCQLVIEAASENKEIKFSLFKKLSELVSSETILATNTSSISITEIAAKTKNPSRVVGMHFMNPVPLMKLVEGIRGAQTSDAAFETVREVSAQLGKTFVAVQDIPGFAVNRILMPMINEAIQALYEGIASAEDIDTAMKLGTNQPMGPLALADLIGLDTCLSIMEVMHEGFSDSKYRPSPLLKKYVAAGWLGRKSGRGFFKYEGK